MSIKATSIGTEVGEYPVDMKYCPNCGGLVGYIGFFLKQCAECKRCYHLSSEKVRISTAKKEIVYLRGWTKDGTLVCTGKYDPNSEASSMKELKRQIDDCEMWLMYPLARVRKGDLIGCLWIHDVPTVHLIDPVVVEGLGDLMGAGKMEYDSVEQMLKDGWRMV